MPNSLASIAKPTIVLHKTSIMRSKGCLAFLRGEVKVDDELHEGLVEATMIGL
jgi:hypothetical protein